MEALRFEGFGFRYPQAAAPVLEGVDWTVGVGEFALLVGATGSGKTTLLRALKPELSRSGVREGSVFAFGKDVWADERAGHGAEVTGLEVGYVAQNPENQTVCDTAWHEMAFGLENLGVDQDAMRRRVAEVAHFFGIEPWFHRQTASLSGGQKQLLNLASVLAMRPKLLLLDEPTAQLDPVAAKTFLHALFRVNRELGITVVLATHSPESAVSYATCAFRVRDRKVESARLSEFEGPAYPIASRSLPSFTEKALRVDEACFRYSRSGGWVLSGMTCDVGRGEVRAVVGGNGCGKSTLLRLIATALKPERGRVRNALSASQALVPQDPRSLFVCDTVEEELMEWSSQAGYGREEMLGMARRFGLSGLLGQHPYDTSGGQQQKVALAKVLLTKPRLLLLDEPAKGLDAPSKYEVACALQSAREMGATVVLVSHDLAFVSCVADSVTMVFDGQDACSEPTERFFEDNVFFRPERDPFVALWEGGKHAER